MQYYATFHGYRNVSFQLIIYDIFLILAPYMDYVFIVLGSNWYPQPMFISQNKKNNEHPSKSQISLYEMGNNLACGYKTFFMLNSAENEICSAYRKLNTVNLLSIYNSVFNFL